MPLPDPPRQAAFPWRRALIALWLSAAVHIAILAFIRVSPAPVPRHAATLQVRLDKLAPVEPRIDLAESFLHPDPLITAPLPELALSPLTAIPRRETPPSVLPIAPKRVADAEKSASLDLPQLADTTYYEALALDIQPQVVSAIVLTDPELDSPSPHVGDLRLELKLEADGKVSEAKVLESNLPRAYEVLALEVFGDAKFTPGRKDGRAVRARIVIEVNFKPREASSK